MNTAAFPRIPFFGGQENTEDLVSPLSPQVASAPQAVPWDTLTQVASAARVVESEMLGEKATAVLAQLSTDDGKEFLSAAFFLASIGT